MTTLNQRNICSRMEEVRKLLVQASARMATIATDAYDIGDRELKEDLIGLSHLSNALLADTAFTLGRAEVVASRE